MLHKSVLLVTLDLLLFSKQDYVLVRAQVVLLPKEDIATQHALMEHSITESAVLLVAQTV